MVVAPLVSFRKASTDHATWDTSAIPVCDLYPGMDKERIITDLISAALDELEAAMPYVPGERVIREDDHGDPVFEDTGPTPRFLELARAHRKRLQGKAD